MKVVSSGGSSLHMSLGRTSPRYAKNPLGFSDSDADPFSLVVVEDLLQVEKEELVNR